MSDEHIMNCDAYMKNRLEFIKRHSTYGNNLDDIEHKARLAEIELLKKKQDKYLDNNTK